MTPRLYIFDADGTLRTTRVPGQPCPHADDEWELLPDVRARLAALPTDALLGVASNQDHVGYGHLPHADAHRLLADMLEAASGRRVPDHAIRLCPHVLEAACHCRKPAPGLLLAILAAYGVAPADALFVGDAPSDEEAARRAGVPFAWAHDFFARRR